MAPVRLPPRTPTASPVRFGLAVGLFLAIFAGSVYGVVWGRPGALLAVTAGYLGYEVLVGLGLNLAAIAAVREWRRAPAAELGRGPLPTVAVLIAAHNERLDILDTLESLRAQGGVRFEVLVASDGSTDGMNALLIETLGLRRERDDLVVWTGHAGVPVRLLALPKLGKGEVLNAALARVDAEVVVTLDADTALAPGALAEMARAFTDPAVQAASGFVYVRNARRGGILPAYQFTEYVKNFIWRMGLSHLGVNLQVSGAFGGLRTETLRRLGGFDGDSLVEDYEVLFHLHERALMSGERYRVVTVPRAAAFTDGPETLRAFVHQRTRWFAGFLQTLWDYRGMIAARRYRRLGLGMLPIKSFDACLPVWGVVSLAILAGSILGGHAEAQRGALLLVGAKFLLDGVMFATMLIWHARAFPERAGAVLSMRAQFACALTEGLAFNWLRQIAVLRAYGWFVRRVRRWEQARWRAPKPSAEPARRMRHADAVARHRHVGP